MDYSLKVAICEDNQDDAERLSSYLKEINKNITVTTYNDSELFLSSNNTFSLVFLDIYMNKKATGINIAKELRKKGSNIDIVFTTSSKDHALEGFEVNAMHYLIKPVEKGQLEKIINSHLDKINQESPYIPIVFENSVNKVYIKDILYIELQGKICYLHLYDKVLPSHLSIKEFSTLLPTTNFIHCHHSFIANLDYVEDIDTDFIMKNGDRVYIRVKELSIVKKKWNQYMVNKIWNEE